MYIIENGQSPEAREYAIRTCAKRMAQWMVEAVESAQVSWDVVERPSVDEVVARVLAPHIDPSLSDADAIARQIARKSRILARVLLDPR